MRSVTLMGCQEGLSGDSLTRRNNSMGRGDAHVQLRKTGSWLGAVAQRGMEFVVYTIANVASRKARSKLSPDVIGLSF